jgi:hypothetical protein
VNFNEYQRRLAAASARACCPACHRRGRAVTVGFVVAEHGFFGLTRRARDGIDDEADLDLLFHQVADGAAWLTDDTFHPPIWPDSTRMAPELARVNDRVIRCRYGHELRVPSTASIDRMLEATNGPIYLRSVRRG